MYGAIRKWDQVDQFDKLAPHQLHFIVEPWDRGMLNRNVARWQCKADTLREEKKKRNSDATSFIVYFAEIPTIAS